MRVYRCLIIGIVFSLLFSFSSSAGPIRVSFGQIQRAYFNLSRQLPRTPLKKSEILSAKYGGNLYLKMETEQPIKAFKVRGAWNFFIEVVQPRIRDGETVRVITASSGNHAQGVAYSAREFGVPAKIFMSEKTPKIKVERTRQLGAEVVLQGQSYDEAYQAAIKSAQESGDLFVHPYQNEHVIAGQGTLALEMVEQLTDAGVETLDLLVLSPVGGGGLIGGIGAALEGLQLNAELVGIQPQAVGSMAQSYLIGEAVQLKMGLTAEPTQADGVAVLKASPEMLELLKSVGVETMRMVSEESITRARAELADAEGVKVEGAGALPLALLSTEEFQERVVGRNVVLILSGGNSE